MKTVAISLSPNTQSDDVLLACKVLLDVLFSKDSRSLKEFQKWFCSYFQTSDAFSFNSGRTALVAILKSFGIKRNDEVILQAFTCGVVPLAIQEVGAIPRFVDINDQFTIDSKDLEKKITPKTKAIIFQYTFGIPEGIDKVLKIAKNHKIPVIEDCAHVIGGEFDGKKLGTLGDASFFSFGRDKAFSSVFGGAAITKNVNLAKKIEQFHESLASPSKLWEIQQLFHPIFFSLILPLYDFFYLGKILLVLFQKIKLLSLPVSKEEKKAKKHAIVMKKFSPALAQLALHQLRKLEEYNKRRSRLVAFYVNALQNTPVTIPYSKNTPLLRFPILVEKREKFLDEARKLHIYLGNWYSNVIDPKDSDLVKLNYHLGSCPNAEKLCKKVVNLPLLPTMRIEQAEAIVKNLQKWYA